MGFLPHEKSFLDLAIALAPIAVSLGTLAVGVYVAFVAKAQRELAQQKLRLDLYNRRFEIFEAALTFSQALEGDIHLDDTFPALHRRFIKAVKESQFLFERSSNIFPTLHQMHVGGMRIIGIKTNGERLGQIGDEAGFIKLFDMMTDALEDLPTQLHELENAMAPYLNFHKVDG